MEALDLSYLPGVYELVKVIVEEDGSWSNEMIRGGLFVFTVNGKLSVTSSSEGSEFISYFGNYQVTDRKLQIDVTASHFPELEKTVLSRTILFLDAECLILEAVGPQSRKKSRLTWKKIAYLQPA